MKSTMIDDFDSQENTAMINQSENNATSFVVNKIELADRNCRTERNVPNDRTKSNVRNDRTQSNVGTDRTDRNITNDENEETDYILEEKIIIDRYI